MRQTSAFVRIREWVSRLGRVITRAPVHECLPAAYPVPGEPNRSKRQAIDESAHARGKYERAANHREANPGRPGLPIISPSKRTMSSQVKATTGWKNPANSSTIKQADSCSDKCK